MKAIHLASFSGNIGDVLSHVPCTEGDGADGGGGAAVGRKVQACVAVSRQQQSAGVADRAHVGPSRAAVGAVVQRAVGTVKAGDGDALGGTTVAVTDATDQRAHQSANGLAVDGCGRCAL